MQPKRSPAPRLIGAGSGRNPDVNAPITHTDPIAPAPEPRPEPRARFAARIDKDGSVTIPASMISPVMGAVLGWWREQSPGVSSGAGPTVDHLAPFPHDAIVDQSCGRIRRDVYLKLARARAFPSRRVGKRVLARWGDVLASISGLIIEAKTAEALDPEEAMRLRWGLARRR